MMKILLFLVPVLLLVSNAEADQFVNGQAADLVIGQSNFTTTTNPYLPGRVFGVIGVARDRATGKVFVSNRFDDRILRYSSAAAARSGADPEAVFGQQNFTDNLPGTSRTSLNEPWGICVDARGRLWVADWKNNRVLCFVNAATRASGAAADFVFGQSQFTTMTYGLTSTGMGQPRDVWVDDADNLWVADTDNSRVLCFFAISSKSSGAAADLVLGQANFTTNGPAATAVKMSSPFGLSVDARGALWVADSFNNRVLRFDNAAGKTNGAAADGVLGQAGFSTSASFLTRSGMSTPCRPMVDRNGTLWVTQFSQGRALGFANAAGLPNGSPATYVLGQADFVSSVIATNARTFYNPAGIELGPNGSLLIAQNGQNRVLRFSPFRTPTIRFSRLRAVSRRPVFTTRGRATQVVTRVRVRVGGSGFRNAQGTNSWRARVRLRPGRNTILAVAEGPGGKSTLVRQRVTYSPSIAP